MPEIKLQHVVSCSSEDKNNPGDNLLKPEGTHKWKSATAGEKSISIVLQFEKATHIHSIDIGNEGSAFVEVLVGRSTAASDYDFQVLLVASAFMTPLEARNGTNRNSVRMFGASQFSAPVASQKWDRVKIVCTQPFNKTSTYGLSFIKFHSPPDVFDKPEHKEEKVLGHFKLKSDENGDVKTGTLFSSRGKTDSPGLLSAAAAARTASKLAEASPKPLSSSTAVASTPSSSAASTSASSVSASKTSDMKESEKNAKAEMKNKTKPTPTPAQNREKRKHHLSDDEDTEEEEVSKPPLRKQPTSLSSVSSRGSAKDEKQPPMKKTKSEPPKASPVKEFSRLMEKVVFVLSGFQNPHRGELRDKAMAMGAVYKPDWGKGCTHLICAFVNTPKYNQVKGKGKIVTQKWINDCYKQKKLLPWRQYRLGDADSPDEDSEEESLPLTKTTPKASLGKKDSQPKKTKAGKADLYGGDTDSGDDTEDEIRKIKQKEAMKTTGAGDGDEDLYGADTDEDEPGPSKTGGGADDEDADSGLPELPDFFADKKFFFYGSMPAADRRLLTRYITAYDGEIEEYMNDKVSYVVTSAKWDKNFDDALADNPNLVFVKPKWIHMCHDKSKLLPHQPYIVVPDS